MHKTAIITIIPTLIKLNKTKFILDKKYDMNPITRKYKTPNINDVKVYIINITKVGKAELVKNPSLTIIKHVNAPKIAHIISIALDVCLSINFTSYKLYHINEAWNINPGYFLFLA